MLQSETMKAAQAASLTEDEDVMTSPIPGDGQTPEIAPTSSDPKAEGFGKELRRVCKMTFFKQKGCEEAREVLDRAKAEDVDIAGQRDPLLSSANLL